jgi:hypothetical protein
MRLSGLVAVLVVGASCSGNGTPSDSASLSTEPPTSNLVEVVAATEQRPYSFMLPEGWRVEDTVHSDGGSFVMAPGASPSAGGKVYGVIEPSGQVVKYDPPPTDKEVRALEANGSEASEPESISVSGRPAWQMLVTRDDLEPASSLFVEVDVGGGAGFQLIFFWASDEYSKDLFTEIVASVEIDSALLASALEGG